MGRLLGFVYLLLCVACGAVKGASTTDGGAPGDGSAGVVCQSNQLVCGNTCVDPKSDNQHCGDCTTACSSATSCSLGHCIDTTASCQVIHLLDPSKPDGPYTHAADGTQFYCDMTDGAVQYDELGFGPYNATTPGFTITTVADLQNPVIQKAFVWLFNHQNGGGIALTAYTSNNCCWTTSTAGGTRLKLGGSIVFSVVGGVEHCGMAFAVGDLVSFERADLTPREIAPKPLPADYFIQHPATEFVGCGDGNNPAYFFKRH